VIAVRVCVSRHQCTDYRSVVSAEGDKPSADMLANGVHGDVSTAIAVESSCKHTAADFDAEAVPLSSFVLNGQDYSKERSMKVGSTHPGANNQIVSLQCSKAMLLHPRGLTKPEMCAEAHISIRAGSCVGGATAPARAGIMGWIRRHGVSCDATQDIADEFWAVDRQRERKQRLVKVGEHHVLRTNMYDLDKVRDAVT
jgi:hypothetical protein